jgi:hypothetical protein
MNRDSWNLFGSTGFSIGFILNFLPNHSYTTIYLQQWEQEKNRKNYQNRWIFSSEGEETQHILLFPRHTLVKRQNKWLRGTIPTKTHQLWTNSKSQFTITDCINKYLIHEVRNLCVGNAVQSPFMLLLSCSNFHLCSLY